MKQQRHSRQRRLVLDMVSTRRDHPTADQVYLDARAADQQISRGTVYRNLNFLAQKGVLRAVKINGADRFECRLDRHDHLLCTGCGAICDVPLPYQQQLDQALAEQTGYAVDGHHTVFKGLCPRCREKAMHR